MNSDNLELEKDCFKSLVRKRCGCTVCVCVCVCVCVELADTGQNVKISCMCVYPKQVHVDIPMV